MSEEKNVRLLLSFLKKKKRKGCFSMYRLFFKRFLDIVLSFFGIVVLAVPMLIIAIIVKIDSKGPAVFKQKRVGKNGKPFNFYKFRSMRIDAPHDMATREIHSEDYITKFGAFLRKTSLDELPQMFCILRGSMSIIGPRPIVYTEEELIAYRKETGAFNVRPGLTGLAQVRYRDNITDMKLKAEIDGEYVQKLSFWLDVKIFFKTIVKVFKKDDIVEGDKVMQETVVVAPVLAEVAVSEKMETVLSETTAKEQAPLTIQSDVLAETPSEENFSINSSEQTAEECNQQA